MDFADLVNLPAMRPLSLALIAVLLLASPAAGQEDSPGREDPLVHPQGDATQGTITPEQARAVAAARARMRAGEAYSRGDYAAALYEWRILAEQGDAGAQSSLGFMYNVGEGVPQDYTEAVRLYRLAAEQGHAGAQVSLGLMYGLGDGVPQDEAESMRWYRMAAEQGHARAQFILAESYRHGRLQNHVEAARWYRKAAEQGEAAAHNALGHVYRLGDGVPQDYVTAHMWFNIAAANRVVLAGQSRDELAELMTNADISEAQSRARICFSSGYQDCD